MKQGAGPTHNKRFNCAQGTEVNLQTSLQITYGELRAAFAYVKNETRVRAR